MEDVSTLARSNPNRVLEIVNKNESSFLAAYDYKMFIDDDDVMNQLVKILYLLAISDDFERIASRTVARIFNFDAKYAYFLCRLERNIKSMGKERSQHALNSNFEKIRHLIDIGLKMICYLPESSLSLFPYLHLKEAVRDLDKKTKVSDDILENMEILSERYDEASSRRLSRQVAFGKFKNSSILPSCEELISGNHRKTLQANIIKGSYRDWNHYLETQYHLMRQDFLIPLRMGIKHLLARDNLEKREETIYVYSNVKIEEPVFLYTGVGFHLRFDPSKHRNIDWDQSKRLIFGSLLCLSKDNFQSSVLFASVTKRDSCLLKDGFVTVKFEEDVCKLKLRVGDTFTMVESMAYFEAYRHILVKLQEMSLSVETLPFQRYIVSSLLHEIPPPSYHLSSKLEFDMSQVLGCSSQVVLSDPTSWPFPSATCLNESQMRALQQALCKEISVIQGPPGTGKTYIGLKAVEAFLVNRSKWDHQKEAPIVVICYTNHALDQFLEGIQQIKVAGKEPNIVRIGGRCKSVKLSEAILKNKVDEYRETRELSRKVLHGLNTAHINMTEIKKEMNATLLSKPKCRVATLSTLKSVMLERHYRSLQRMSGQEDTKIKRWLDGISFHHSSYDQKAENFADDREEITDVIEANTLEQIRATEGEEIDFVDFSHPREATVIKDNEAKRQKLDTHAISYKSMTLEEVYKIDDIFSLSRHKKQELYSYWMNKIHGDLAASKKNMDDYEAWCKKYRENRHEIEKEVLFEIDVVGMTTTGAAKHHHILQNIHPKIVIFEEAAEIFESHIITSLPVSVQQLILIGDHQQLKPKPNTYDLEVNFNLGVSLFERLVLNGIEYTTLEVQHRMRPEISSLIHPSIYHNMLDHESVTRLEPVRGIAESVFMITHSCHENCADKMESTTHTNEFEADYLVSLCDYLLKQGYKPSMITILAMYRGQLFEFKRKMKGRERFHGVRVAVVDDFQGEENDIILLSLVRSNSNKNIGFVGDSNRICVSLSRAKLGLYIIGNKEMFCDQDKTKWPQIIKVLEDRKCIHHSLPLFCRVHPDSKVWAKVPEDFLKSPEGGCDRKCGTRLACGHACPKMCHPKDMNHENYKCLKPCTQVFPCNHKCKNVCWKCKNGCPPCKENVEKVISKCGHTGFMYCSADPNKFKCVKTCTKPLKICGHPCSNKCYEKCTTNCVVLTGKKLLCGHTIHGKCSEDIKCSEPCRGILDCGDKCTGTCSECHMGRMHKQCQKECGRQLFCGHICSSLCASDCPPCVKSCTNFCVHSRCPKKCYEPCTPCMEPCQWECKHLKCTKLCGEICNRPPCNKPCEKHLKKCGHPCIGLCGEECPSLCRICDKEEVCEIFFGTEDEEDARFIQLKDCSHLLEVTGLDRFVNDNDVESGGLVKFSECPKCRTPIRTSLRYCNKVKEVLNDVEELKKKQLMLPDGLIEKVRSLHKCVGNQKKFLQDELDSLSNKAKNYKSLHPRVVNTMFVQASIFGVVLQILKMFSCLPGKIKNLKNGFPVCDLSRLKKDLKAVKCFVSQEYLSKHQIADVTCETRRILCAAKLCDLLCKISDSVVLNKDHQISINLFAKMFHEGGWNQSRVSADKEDQFVSFIGEIEKSYNLKISEKERIEIVKAIGLKKGHWYKCENGHYYCIGECGGAMERGKCPECGIVIGGESHTLAAGNVHAGEMDNSRHSAWSNFANLENYDLEND